MNIKLKELINSARDETLQCNECDYKATFKSSLKVHIQSKHEKIVHKCNDCDYKATFRSSLNIHIQSKHKNILHKCSECEKVFKNKSYMRKHQQDNHEGRESRKSGSVICVIDFTALLVVYMYMQRQCTIKKLINVQNVVLNFLKEPI